MRKFAPPGRRFSPEASLRLLLSPLATSNFRGPSVRIQRRFVSLLAGLVAVAVVSACGGSSSSAISGKSPVQLLVQALSKADGQQFKFTSTTTLTADLSQVTGFSAAQLGAFGPALANGVNVTINGTYEVPPAPSSISSWRPSPRVTST